MKILTHFFSIIAALVLIGCGVAFTYERHPVAALAIFFGAILVALPESAYSAVSIRFTAILGGIIFAGCAVYCIPAAISLFSMGESMASVFLGAALVSVFSSVMLFVKLYVASNRK